MWKKLHGNLRVRLPAIVRAWHQHGGFEELIPKTVDASLPPRSADRSFARLPTPLIPATAKQHDVQATCCVAEPPARRAGTWNPEFQPSAWHVLRLVPPSSFMYPGDGRVRAAADWPTSGCRSYGISGIGMYCSDIAL